MIDSFNCNEFDLVFYIKSFESLFPSLISTNDLGSVMQTNSRMWIHMCTKL